MVTKLLAVKMDYQNVGVTLKRIYYTLSQPIIGVLFLFFILLDV